MQRPPVPHCEAERIGSLYGTRLLDSEPEERFDRLTRIATAALGVPIALVSLVDTDREWFKSNVGLDAAEIGRDVSFCAHTILSSAALVVEDASLDPRFQDSPLVAGEHHIRFYAGFPLDDGYGNHLGTFSVMDREPRNWTDLDQAVLKEFADLAQLELTSDGLEASVRSAREGASRIDAILAAAADGIITIDEQGIIESVNPAAERIFGYSREELVGENVSLLMPSPFRENHDQYIQNYLDTGEAKIIGVGREAIGLTKDGKEFPIDLAIGVVETATGRLFTGIIRDITERKEVDRMKTDFVSLVSHELRTPLTSIRGSLGLLDGGVAGELDEQARSMVRLALDNCERLARLVDDILDVEKIEAGKLEYRMETVDLVDLLSQAVAGNEGLCVAHNVAFDLTPQIADVRVTADSDRLIQVVTNLLSNAARFSPPGATVEVSVLDGELGPRVEVTDHGPGIREEFRPRLFDKFAKDDAPDSRRKDGSGLGLNVCRGIIDDHGGRIGFETELGAGTTFFFELPTPTDSVQAPGHETAPDGAAAGCPHFTAAKDGSAENRRSP